MCESDWTANTWASLGFGVLGLDGFWFAVSFVREADFFQVNPRAHESGFDVGRYGRVVRSGERNGLKVHCLRERGRSIDATARAGFRLTARRHGLHGDDRHFDRQYGA
jgi:hypothetical protein